MLKNETKPKTLALHTHKEEEIIMSPELYLCGIYDNLVCSINITGMCNKRVEQACEHLSSMLLGSSHLIPLYVPKEAHSVLKQKHPNPRECIHNIGAILKPQATGPEMSL